MGSKRIGLSCLVALLGATTYPRLGAAITLSDARLLPPGTDVTIEGAVISSTTDLINSNTSKSFQIQDATGGATVYGTNAQIDGLLAGLAEGDEVTITGSTGLFNGLFQLQGPFSATKTGSPGVPAPVAVTTAYFQDGAPAAEAYESMLVTLSNVQFQETGNFAYGNYHVSDGIRTVLVRVSTTQLDLVGQPIPTGFVSITGILSQYDTADPRDGGYQLLPRKLADIVSVPGNAPPVVSNASVWLGRGAATDILLNASDDGLPTPPGALELTIVSLPALGTLTDLGSNTPITAVPYVLPGNGRQVRYTSDGTCGHDSFTFKASDGALESGLASVDVTVQCGDVIITEIMYNPASNENTPKVTEWVEVYNTTAAPVDVSGWYLIDRDGRSGDWPAGTVIPAYGVAVIIPQGTIGTRFMDAAQFRAAWDGYDIPLIIQPMAGTGWSNEIAGNGLANDPPSGGEQLRLVDATGKVQDVASYDNSFPWPSPTGESSIFLTEGNYTAAANDLGSNWANSRNCAGGAYGCLIGGFFDATDFGSPGFLAGLTTPTGNVPPTPLWQRVGVLMNTPATITLTACDDGNPVGGPVSYTITGLPSHGTLKDPGNGADIVTVPYVLTNNGNQVVYTPAADYTSVLTDLGGPGDDSFTFAVNDGAKPSRSDGTVRLIVQKGGLIITEVMYNPNNQPDNAWEWIEIANVSGADVYLDRITDDDTSATTRVIAYIGQTIPAGQVRIIAPSEPVGRTNDDFLTEWAVAPASQLDPALVVFVDLFNNTWGALDNAGDRLQLVGFDGVNYVLLDDIIYTNNAPWPVSNNQASIYLKYGEYDAVGNDVGENWALSTAGTDNAYATPETPGDPTDSDVGSPLLGPLPGCAVPPQDTDGDGDVDVNDFAVFQACFNGAANPYPPLSPEFLRKCICVDHDTDGDVDVNDFAVFQVCFNGSGNPPAQPACDLANSPS